MSFAIHPTWDNFQRDENQVSVSADNFRRNFSYKSAIIQTYGYEYNLPYISILFKYTSIIIFDLIFIFDNIFYRVLHHWF